jgi:hypothetical protein
MPGIRLVLCCLLWINENQVGGDPPPKLFGKKVKQRVRALLPFMHPVSQIAPSKRPGRSLDQLLTCYEIYQ